MPKERVDTSVPAKAKGLPPDPMGENTEAVEPRETTMRDSKTIIGADSLAYAEEIFERYLRDPRSVTDDWRRYFDQLQSDGGPPGDDSAGFRRGPSFEPPSLFAANSARAGNLATTPEQPINLGEVAALQDRVDQIVRAYRVRGHLIARIDPLGMPRAEHPELDPEFYGLTETDLERVFSTRTISGTAGQQTLRSMLQRLRNTYCRSIGVQFMHIDDLALKNWLQTRMERTENRLALGRDEQIRILTKLTDAVIFEDFVQKKYLGAKRFSLEGGESLIPLLDMAVERAGEQGIEEIVIGMPHRGRLNVLANIVRKHPAKIFREFEDADPELSKGRGDVKYHLGYSTDIVTSAGQRVHLSLCFNPSHLEFVSPVALGRLRAKQDRVGDFAREKGLAILIHGDAAFAGEGIVQETLNLSELKGYRVGGTVHIIVNNQIGFTTSPAESRSSLYATDVARMLQIPIFHVNGEDPEAVAQVIRLAMDFRQTFKQDVVIDMYCYRRHGHNEGDEPAFTHPVLYAAIKKRPSVRRGYLEHLQKLGEISDAEADEIARSRRELLEMELARARSPEYQSERDTMGGIWSKYYGGPEEFTTEVDTSGPLERLSALLESIATVPEDFHPHPKIVRLLKARREMASGARPLDWATAELLAFATLAVEGHPVRLSGQDCGRGTFSHRHGILHDHRDGRPYHPLKHLREDQGRAEILNSPLSEAGVLGFEYGYSLDCPEGLIVWEAQFGDFVNVAQVIIDQFLVSAEDKWQRLSALVMLLPHGLEGQGPEHSSARLERFMAQAAKENIQIAQPTTPAQYFHLLRRQVLRPWRKPLIVMTPKSLLRSPAATSHINELAGGGFQRIIPDSRKDPGETRRILLCSGKVYYDLVDKRAREGHDDVAILRCEQLYPLTEKHMGPALAGYADDTPVFWVQEEPENMGAWQALLIRYGRRLLGRFPFEGVTRARSSTPATGSARSHKLEQQELLAKAFADDLVPEPASTARETS